MGVNVLSLFNGMGCIWLALDRLGVKVNKRYSAEIDKYANIINDKNYPDTIQLGDVRNVRGKDLHKIDLVVGGSPCQGFSFAGKQLNFEDPRSVLFFEYTRILGEIEEINPDVKFLLENVKMKKAYQNIISDHLLCGPVEINSSLVSAQNRKRLYWTNITGVEQPEDREIFLKDIVLPGAVDSLYHFAHGFTKGSVKKWVKSPSLTTQFHNNYFPVCGRLVGRRTDTKGTRHDYSDIPIKQRFEARVDGKSGTLTTVQKDNLLLSEKALEYMNREVRGGRTHWDFKHHSDIREPKLATIVANFFKGVPYNVLKTLDVIRKFHPIECERLQTVPDNYTEGVSNTQRYKMLGNGWTVEVIKHILSYEYGS